MDSVLVFSIVLSIVRENYRKGRNVPYRKHCKLITTSKIDMFCEIKT